MSDIWVVEGSWGYYEDKETWAVAAFHDEGAARQFVVDCQIRARECLAEYGHHWHNAIDPKYTLLDPHLTPYKSASISYYCYALELR